MEAKVENLKKKLEKIGTRDLLGMISIQFMTFGNDGKDIAEQSDIFTKTELMSPQKQYLYLAGLLMSTDDKSNGQIIHEEDSEVYSELESNVQDITFEYIKNFLDVDIITDKEKIEKNFVTMEAFTSYFDTGILRYPEQTEELIKNLYGKFDTELAELTGLSIDDYLSFYQLVYDEFEEAMNEPKRTMERIMNSFNPFGVEVDIEKTYDEFLRFSRDEAGKEIMDSCNRLNTIKASKIIETYGREKAEKLLEQFGLHRQKRDFIYYNSINPFSSHPLCWLDDDNLFIIHPQFVLSAVYEKITDSLENPQNTFGDKYKKIKAEVVENLFLKVFQNILGNSAKYHVSVCEERGTKEHDLLIEYEKYIIIAEVKASKVREPMFNPEKAYKRIKDHFNSDTGIGGAYEQAIILKKFIENSNGDVVLFENRTKRFVIENIAEKIILPVILTLNQFGSLAINTSMLLKKEDEQPYPWVCNWHDFEDISEIIHYLNKTPNDFINYLLWRMKYHEYVLSSDELDVIEGYFRDKHVQTAKLGTKIFFPPTGPSLIDKIYFEKNGIPYDLPDEQGTIRKNKKIGRNDPCPCGSGRKFKKCCVGKGIYD